MLEHRHQCRSAIWRFRKPIASKELWRDYIPGRNRSECLDMCEQLINRPCCFLVVNVKYIADIVEGARAAFKVYRVF